MKVTIITISYNSEKTIKATLKSVIDQKYKNIEHIVIDGNSNDNTIKICKTFPHIFNLISDKDKGVYDAFNKGLKIATGEIIGFLNSDDIFYDRDSLQNIVNGFDKNIDAVFGNLNFYNKKNKIIRKWISKPYEKGAFNKAWMPPHPTFYCKKKIYDKFGNYNDSFKIAGDFELMLRFIDCNSIKTKFLNKNLIKMKAGGISNSGLKSKFKILNEEFRSFRLNKIKFNKIFYLFYKFTKIKEFL